MKKISRVTMAFVVALVSGSLVSVPSYGATVHETHLPSTTTDAVFSISGTTVTVGTNSVWVDGTTLPPGVPGGSPYTVVGTPTDQIFACEQESGSVSTGIGSGPDFFAIGGGCQPLYFDLDGTVLFDGGNLMAAFLSGRSYTNEISIRPHLRVVSHVDSNVGTRVWVASLSQEFIQPAPTVDVEPSLTISGDTIQVTHGEWAGGIFGDSGFMACRSAVTSEVTTYQPAVSDPLSPPNCLGVFVTTNGPLDRIATSYSVDDLVVFGMGGLEPYDSIKSIYSHISLRLIASVGGTSYAVHSASSQVGGSSSNSDSSDSSGDVVRATPYTGPVLNTPAITSSIPAGGKVVIPGSNLSGVTAVEVGGVAATVVVNSDGELEITVPAGLAAGNYDLVVVSSSGRLTVQNAITVSGSAVDATAGAAAASTKRMQDGTAKVWVFDVVGAGKVQIYVNGKEIAWVRTDNPNDPKLTNGYLVRTVNLLPGKNVIEVFVDGERVRRTAYSN